MVPISKRRLLHISIIVDNLEEAVKTYTLLGFQSMPQVRLDEFNVTMVEMRGENVCIELAEPLSTGDKPMVRGVHHLAFNSWDLVSDLRIFPVEKQVAMAHQSFYGKVFSPPDNNQGGLSMEFIAEEMQDGK